MAPLVHIAIPCFNEQSFIVNTVRSALHQTYANIEVVVYDNCSTDDTVKLVREHFQSDKRLRIHRHEVNIGATNNFKQALELSGGDYFMWLGGHDVISPWYVQEAVEILESNKSISLVYTDHLFVDENNLPIETPALSDIETIGLTKLDRLLKVAKNLYCCTSIHGVFRQEYKSRIPFVKTVGPDHLMLFSLANAGEIKFIRKIGYHRREIRKQETLEQQLKRYREYGMEVKPEPYKLLALEHFKYAYDQVRWSGNYQKAKFFFRLKNNFSFLSGVSWDELMNLLTRTKETAALYSFFAYCKRIELFLKYYRSVTKRIAR